MNGGPPRRICATTTGRKPQDRRRHIDLTITGGRMMLHRLQDPQTATALISGLIMKSRTGQSLMTITGRDTMFPLPLPLRLTAITKDTGDIGNKQRFFEFQQ